jgi:hypothetical protein
VHELEDFTSPTPETLQRLQALIDDASGAGLVHCTL